MSTTSTRSEGVEHAAREAVRYCACAAALNPPLLLPRSHQEHKTFKKAQTARKEKKNERQPTPLTFRTGSVRRCDAPVSCLSSMYVSAMTLRSTRDSARRSPVCRANPTAAHTDGQATQDTSGTPQGVGEKRRREQTMQSKSSKGGREQINGMERV